MPASKICLQKSPHFEKKLGKNPPSYGRSPKIIHRDHLRYEIICTYPNQFRNTFASFRLVPIFDFSPKCSLDFIYWWSWHRNNSNENCRRTISGFVSEDFLFDFNLDQLFVNSPRSRHHNLFNSHQIKIISHKSKIVRPRLFPENDPKIQN